MANQYISVVAPVLNEIESLPELHRELTEVLESIGKSYEIIFVDDGSDDGSTDFCRKLVKADRHVVLVELRRRFGKATALQAGFKVATGDVVFTIDADLQDDPKEIPRFLEALEDDYDVISGWKKDRKDPLSKTIPSKFFNYVTSKASGLALRDFNCGFKAYRREVIENLNVYGELYRYIPVIVHAKGFRVGEIPVSHRTRQHGKSKYGIERFIRGPLDLLTTLFLTTFRTRPLHLFGPIGGFLALAGFAMDLFLAVLWLRGEFISNRPLLLLGTLMIIVGVQILIFGLLAEMITATAYRPNEINHLIRRVSRNVPDLAASARKGLAQS